MNDALGALRDWLATRTAVTDLTGARIFVNRIPRSTIEAEDTFHPQKMVVLRHAGGLPKADNMPTDDPTITVLCYGESDFEADRVRLAVWQEFVDLSHVLQDSVRFLHVNPAGGALPLVDPDIVWPAMSQNFTTKAVVF